MDWMYVAPEDSTSAMGELGFYVGDRYKVAANATCTLHSICARLASEDKSLRTFRRKLGFSQIVHKDLAPILVECNTPDSFEVFAAAIKLLADMTTPLECLFASLDIERSDEGAHTMYELKQHLSDIKNLFLDPKIDKSVLNHMERILNKGVDMTMNEKHLMVNCVTLLRNILHIPEEGPSALNSGENSGATTDSPISSNGDANSGNGESPTEEDTFGAGVTKENSTSSSSGQPCNQVRRQHQVLWNLFAHNLDSVIMSLIESTHFKMWSTPLVQLIALVYKDQHVTTLERLLSIWLESSLSESSEDNESNTTPHIHQDGNGCCSSSLLTSTEPNSTDDSSDGNGNGSGRHSDKGTCGSSGEASSPESLEKIDDGDNIEAPNVLPTVEKNSPQPPETPTNISPTPEGTGATSTGLKILVEPAKSSNSVFPVIPNVSDIEMKSDISSDSCREPPRKKVAMSRSSIDKASKRNSSSDIDSGLSSTPMTPSTIPERLGIALGAEENSNQTATTSTSRPEVEKSGKKSPNSKSKSNSETSSTSSNLVEDNKEPQEMDIDKTTVVDKKESSEEGYGYVSAQANLKPKVNEQQESNSTSSNDEDIGRKRNVTPHTNLQKPRPKKKIISAAEKRELRRKKLIERSKSKRLKVKALVHHIPTDEDIADLLKEFTVDFLLKGYPSLVTVLRLQLMSDENTDIDKSHFLWLITYFLKFALQLEVELEQIGPVLSVETVAYLTYEGVRFFEELELAVREQRERPVDLRPYLRRIHLVVTALREFIQTLQTYAKFSHFNDVDKSRLKRIQLAVCSMRDLRQLFLLLIRRYNSSLQTRQYLNDVVCGNHALLVMIENTKIDVDIMTSHLTQFATVEVMRQYGQLLESFDTNSEFVNDCIFTMMHHVCGDLNTPETLFIPQVLETFSEIWERQEDVEICDDWADLIEYVIQRFISTIRSRPHAYATNLLECLNNSEAVDENGFTKSQLDVLYSYYTQFEDAPDPVGCVIEVYKRNSNVTKTRLAVIQALLSQGIISLAQYMNMMYMKSVLTTCKTEHEGSVVVEVGSERCDSEGHDTDIENPHDLNAQNKDQIETLKELLKKQGKACLLTWLQQTLLDACCVKINGNELFTPERISLEPVPFHFNHINQSIPMVAWSKNQESGLQTETFMLLLHKLGFHLATDVGKCFPRIPHFWSADHLYNLALKIGPLRKDELKMDLSLLETSSGCQDPAEALNEPENSAKSKTELKPFDEATSPASSKLCGSGSEVEATLSTVETTTAEYSPFAIPTPTTSWIQLALTSKRAHMSPDHKGSKESILSTPTNMSPRAGSLSDLSSDRGDATSSSMEKMQISDENDLGN